MSAHWLTQTDRHTLPVDCSMWTHTVAGKEHACSNDISYNAHIRRWRPVYSSHEPPRRQAICWQMLPASVADYSLSVCLCVRACVGAGAHAQWSSSGARCHQRLFCGRGAEHSTDRQHPRASCTRRQQLRPTTGKSPRRCSPAGFQIRWVLWVIAAKRLHGSRRHLVRR